MTLLLHHLGHLTGSPEGNGVLDTLILKFFIFCVINRDDVPDDLNGTHRAARISRTTIELLHHVGHLGNRLCSSYKNEDNKDESIQYTFPCVVNQESADKV